MSWVPAEQVLQAVKFQRDVIAQQEQRLAEVTTYHRTERQKLDAERLAASNDLGQALLPRLDAPSIAAAAAATGMVNLPAEDLPGQLEARRAWLANRLQEILRTPEYAQRELLRHPRTGSLTRALAENIEYRNLASQFVGECELHPRFAQVLEAGFGTPEEKAPWWRYSYWQNRSAAAEIVAKSGKASFAEVRDEYMKRRQDVATYDAEIDKLRQQIGNGENLEREYATVWDEHQTLDARGLEHTRHRLVEHMLGVDASALGQHLRASSSPLMMLFLRASGLAAKARYLDGIHANNASEMARDLATQKAKLDNVEQKTRRRWGPMPADKYQKLTVDPRPRYDKRFQRWGKVYQTVYVYDRWDRARYYDDLLWWDLMTRGRYDGSFLSDVQTYHQMHPDYAFDPNWKAQQDAVDAEAAAESARADALLVVDDTTTTTADVS